MLEKRKAEEEKTQKAEKLRRALQVSFAPLALLLLVRLTLPSPSAKRPNLRVLTFVSPVMLS